MKTTISVKEATRILEEEQGYRFVSSRVERRVYDLKSPTNYKVASERIYYFEDGKGDLRMFRAATLRSAAREIASL